VIHLHIGRHKTGTTAIQRSLRTNKDVLASQGFLYPGTGLRRFAHHNLAAALDPRKEPDGFERRDLLNDFRSEVERATDVIVSSESFQNLQPIWVSRFFNPGGVTIIVYIREQLEYLLSAYSQRIQANVATETFDSYAERLNINYDIFLRGWENIFGRDLLRVRVYDRKRLWQGDIVRDFYRTLGVEMDDRFAATDSDDANISLSYRLTVWKRLLNRLISVEQHTSWRLYNVFAALAAADTSALKRVPVSRSLADKIRERQQESNIAVFSRYLHDDRNGFELREFASETDFELESLEPLIKLWYELAPQAANLLQAAIKRREFVLELPEEERLMAHHLSVLSPG
jgi:hypothetical protein